LDKISINIDGRDIETTAGKSVLDAALDAGIYIPHLCHHPDLRSAGSCRLCICEIEGIDGLPASCTTPVADGMIVKTKSKQINKLRYINMELLLAAHPADCKECPKYLNCELQSLKQYLGIAETLRVKKKTLPYPVNNDNPLFVHDFQRCILCGRCVRACYDLRGVGVLSFIGRGRETHIGTAYNDLLVDAGCIFCGACVEVCPTAALRDKEGIIDENRGRRASLVPCKYTCPAEIDIPRYIRLINRKDYISAAAVVREKAPFPAVLGYVCNHPCESVCRRGQVKDPVAIKNLKRFAAEHADNDWKQRVLKFSPTGKKVAVIGSGPAGLTAAYYLSAKGHAITVFEALPVTGGMLRVGIPEYRLPKAVLDKEINDLENSGIEIKTGVKIESPDLLFEQGFDAVLVAVGAHRGQKLSIPGTDNEGVIISTDFLRDVNTGNEVKVGKKVLVIGGGNVAFDCACVSRRLGASEVEMACLERGDEMLASPEEIEQGKQEGILIHNSHNFSKILGDNGKVTGVECQDVESFRFDESGTLCIDCIQDSEHVIEADTVIFAIGQRPEIPEEFNLNTGRGNTIDVNQETMSTSRQGVFAAGDAVSGTASVIEAIASGRKAASEIDKYLGGNGIIDETLADIIEPDPRVGRKGNFAYQERCATELVPVEQRLEGFEGMDKGYDECSAVEESSYCLQCDLRLRISRSKFWADYLSQ
jgi:NADPH-dependent glutamate synthase beta subunit-like oxidoreductase